MLNGGILKGYLRYDWIIDEKEKKHNFLINMYQLNKVHGKNDLFIEVNKKINEKYDNNEKWGYLT